MPKNSQSLDESQLQYLHFSSSVSASSKEHESESSIPI